jgi:hypothetical protein
MTEGDIHAHPCASSELGLNPARLRNCNANAYRVPILQSLPSMLVAFRKLDLARFEPLRGQEKGPGPGAEEYMLTLVAYVNTEC